jgi:hypothetical protein
MSRLRASETDVIAASPSVWCASYAPLFCFQCVAVIREAGQQRTGTHTPVRMALTSMEPLQLVLVAIVYTIMENLQFYVLEHVVNCGPNDGVCLL